MNYAKTAANWYAEIGGDPAHASVYNRPNLAASLEQHDIEYHWFESLGGHRKEGLADSPNFGIKDEAFRNYADHILSDEFRDGVDRLLDIAENKRVAIMCAETSFHDCHRKTVPIQRRTDGLRIDLVRIGGGRLQREVHEVEAVVPNPLDPPQLGHERGDSLRRSAFVLLNLGFASGNRRCHRQRQS